MRTHRLPVCVSLLFLRPAACPADARRSDIATWRSPTVEGASALALPDRPLRLWELDRPAALATLPPELASLVPLVNHGTPPPERVVQVSLFRALDVADPRPREDAYACTAALTALYFDRALVRRRVEERMIVELPQMQELLRERTEIARRQAAEQALLQGV